MEDQKSIADNSNRSGYILVDNICVGFIGIKVKQGRWRSWMRIGRLQEQAQK
jgi:hypothetical protein